MIYSNIDFTVLYVDPSASTNGNGATPQSAMNALPGDGIGVCGQYRLHHPQNGRDKRSEAS